jgi:malate dehydrogenase (oxaloacetate-decarboxylating)
MDWLKTWYADHTNPGNERGSLQDALRGADVFLGLSAPGVIRVDDIRTMKDDPIVFAMANPIPEIMPEEAEGHVTIMATGRSDYPNQINNVLCFPGIFRGALDARAPQINEAMKLAAAHAIAATIAPDELGAEYIVPSVFDRRVSEAVARAVSEAAHETGVARREHSRSEQPA